VRDEVRELPAYNAGLSIEYVRAHYGVTKIAKLGSNENPYGPSPWVVDAVARAASDIAIYPDASCDALRAALAKRLAVSPDRLIFGNGSEDLIAICAHTFLSPGNRVVTFAPSFGLHIIYPESVGAVVDIVPVDARYQMNIGQVLSALRAPTRMLLFGNPSNPVGSSITADDMRQIIANVSPETLIVFDEAYLEYASTDPDYPDFFALLEQCRSPWLILRTFSKAYGLAGLRVGYAIASDPELIQLMDRIRAPFNVNRLAQVAAIAALEDTAYVERVVTRTVRERARIEEQLTLLGYSYAPSLANFLFVKANEDASVLAERLLAHGVIVKPWRELNYRDHLRVTIGSPEANNQFLEAWKKTAS
jgi:histidinol-phosphate aminotransferase